MKHPAPRHLSSESASLWPVVAAGGVLVLTALVAYHNSFAGALLLDDRVTISANPSIRQLWPIGPVLNPPPELTVAGRPLANLSFALNYALSGTALRGYHVVNFLIHVGAGLALFGVLRRTLQRLHANALQLAFLATAAWMLHPALTESVTYLSQRTESLMGLCYLLTLYCFIRGTQQSPRRWLPLSVVCCALGMTAKEVMVTAPFLVMLYDRTFVAGSFGAAWRRRTAFYSALAATWLLLVHRAQAGFSLQGIGYEQGLAWWRYALIECRGVLIYAKLTLWPHPLVFDYGPASSPAVVGTIPYALTLAGLVAGAFWAAWKRPAIGFLALWFFVILAPTSSVVPVALQPIAENRLYLPLAGATTLIVFALNAAIGRRAVLVSLMIAASYAFLAERRNETYRSELYLWTDTVAKLPLNPRAHNSLGYVLAKAGQLPAAKARYAEALRLKPDFSDAEYNLAYAHLDLGEFPSAISHFEAALRLKPTYPTAHNGLAVALISAGRPADALAHCDSALQLDPELSHAHYNKGIALQTLGRSPEALAEYEAELHLSPGDLNVQSALGSTYLQLGRADDAVRSLERVVGQHPANADAQLNLAGALLQLGRAPEAVVHSEAGLRLKSNFAFAHNLHGLVLNRLGRIDAAVAAFESAVRLNPNSAEAQANLTAARAAQTAAKAK